MKGIGVRTRTSRGVEAGTWIGPGAGAGAWDRGRGSDRDRVRDKHRSRGKVMDRIRDRNMDVDGVVKFAVQTASGRNDTRHKSSPSGVFEVSGLL